MEKTEVKLPSKEVVLEVLAWLHAEKDPKFIDVARGLTASYGSKLGHAGGMDFVTEVAEKTMPPAAKERAQLLNQIRKYFEEDGLPEHVVMAETARAAVIIAKYTMTFGETPRIVRQPSQYTLDVGLPGIYLINPEV